jgi:hypothetical protein
MQFVRVAREVSARALFGAARALSLLLLLALGRLSDAARLFEVELYDAVTSAHSPAVRLSVAS